jgi:hypothetical protein
MSITISIRKHARLEGPGPILFVIVRNEQYLLPHFFRHYERLGVNQFLVYDDNSTDGTAELLQRMSNCIVLGSNGKFSDVVGRPPNGIPLRFGPYLKLEIATICGVKGWMLTVDADEFLVLPPGFDTVQDFILHLESVGQPYLTAPMVDFYPPRLRDRNFDRDLDPFLGCPYFDVGPYYQWTPERLDPDQLFRGVRARLLQMLAEADLQTLRQAYGKHPMTLAKNWKVPLLKHGQGIRYVNDHEISVHPAPGIQGCLAHFKFCPNLDEKIAFALSSGAYYNASMEYRFLAATIERLEERSLLAPESMKYCGPESLVAAGLLSARP